MSSYGDDGKKYVNWCANLAQSYQVGIPWVMCQQDNAPDPMLNSCNGFYCDQFYPNSQNKPKMWTENWTGWFKNWGGQIPHRTAEDVAFAVEGFSNMYHGGTNFGRTSGGPYITTSYDYDAPLDEYGNLNQPKWGHLKKLHEVLKSIEDVLVNGHRRMLNMATIYSHGGKSACFLAMQIIHMMLQLISRTINIMFQLGLCLFFQIALMKLIALPSVNVDDNMWTKKDVQSESIPMVTYFMHLLMENMQAGTNEISLLSATVGLPNYGAYFDNVEVGVGGPIHLVTHDESGDEVVKNITNNVWNYKIGLHGENAKHYEKNSLGWLKTGLPTDRIFTWYKTKFNSPIGNDPVAVDLSGLGKGQAWVNGNNIGRYWPTYLADDNGCSTTCDFRGAYTSSKCATGCGKPTQQWYHIPRSFLNEEDENELVLFEEMGGHPFNIKFATVTIGNICANAYEGNTLELSCHENQVISEFKFVSFGQPQGQCGSFTKSQCEASNTLQHLKEKCLGKSKCSVHVSERILGSTGCKVEQIDLQLKLCSLLPQIFIYITPRIYANSEFIVRASVLNQSMAVESSQDLLKKLEYLSLVSKVCTEMESHTGNADKVLAEFITELGRSSENFEEFDAKLKENGAELPDYFVRTLLKIIHAILPPKKGSGNSDSKGSKLDGGVQGKFRHWLLRMIGTGLRSCRRRLS
ncbi:beta-galactosidase-like [Arachis hypogaea]|uniref:beta-galactosidase-like n=1 Tax=Arachis hypogaea TaxID=3818 RepID=UPI003B219C85